MKKVGIILLVLVLLVLNFSALDDIATGNEPTLAEEYFILVGSAVMFAAMIFLKIKRVKEHKNK